MNIPSTVSHIEAIERELLQHLAQHELTAGYRIYPTSAQRISDKINRAIAKLGLVGLLEMDESSVSNPNAREPIFDTQKFQIRWIENPLFNRGPKGQQVPARAMAIRTVQALWHFRPTEHAAITIVKPQQPTVVHVPDRKALIYAALFEL